jgi:hypothetical protein
MQIYPEVKRVDLDSEVQYRVISSRDGVRETRKVTHDWNEAMDEATRLVNKNYLAIVQPC